MLVIDDAQKTIVHEIEQATCLVELPDEWNDFFETSGPTSRQFEDCRRFQRWNYRVTALMRRKGEITAVLTKDISRMGIAFLNHEQLFPLESIELLLPDGRGIIARIRRCLRIKENCFECGAIFDRDEAGPA